MSGIDFLQQPNDSNDERSNNRTPVEYTQPKKDVAPVKPAKPGLFKRLFGGRPKTPIVPQQAKPATVPTSEASAAPTKPTPVEAKHVEPEKPVAQPKPTPAVELPMAPPPPSKQFAPEMAPAITASTMPQMPAQPASKPQSTAPQPVASQPAAPAMPAAPAAPVSTQPTTPTNLQPNLQAIATRTAGDTSIHAQNVSKASGKLTQPEILTEAAFSINLLPQNKENFIQRSPVLRLLRSATIVIFIMAAAYGGMVGYRTYAIYETQNTVAEIKQLEQQIVTFAPLQNDINTTNQTLTAISDVLGNRLYWTNLFVLLERYTLPNVQYISVAGNANGNITLQAITTDFTSVTRQAEIFTQAKDVFTDVTVVAANRSGDSSSEEDTNSNTNEAATQVLGSGEQVTFSINTVLAPGMLHYQARLPQP